MTELLIDLVSRPWSFYEWCLTRADKRVENWFLMGSYWPTWALTIVYILAVHYGKQIMAQRKALELKPVLFIYNVALVALNFHIFFELFTASLKLKYNYLCQPVSYSDDPDEMRIASALWWYYFSKCIEFMDTIFFVLRKKNNQISFLHVYHHATMFPIWWMGVKWVAGGQSFFGALINSFIHVLMYSYYGLSSMGPAVQPYLWWKRYLTRLQLIQFFIGMIVGVYSLVTKCGAVPLWMEYAGMCYGLSMITLFFNFYYHEYILSRANSKRRDHVTHKGVKNGVANGHTSHTNGVSNGDTKKIK